MKKRPSTMKKKALPNMLGFIKMHALQWVWHCDKLLFDNVYDLNFYCYFITCVLCADSMLSPSPALLILCAAMRCDEHYSSFSCMHTQTYVFIHTTLVTNQPKGNWCATRAPHEREIFWMQMRAMQWSNRVWNSFEFRYMQLMQPGLYDSVGL